MANEGFWSNPGNQAPPRSVITADTVGDVQVGPVGYFPGTSAGAVPVEFTAAAQRVYPWNFDYTDTVRKAEYDALVANKFDQFSSWHSLYQAKYIAENGPVAIPASGRPDAYYVVLADGRSVRNVMSLTLSEYQRLSRADRTMLEGNAVFTTYMAPTLGLVSKNFTPAGGKSVTTKLNDALASVDSFSLMPVDDRKVFKDQLTLLQNRLGEATLVAFASYDREIGAILQRFSRAKEFSYLRDEFGLTTYFQGTERDYLYAKVNTDVVAYAYSSDHGETVKSGYQAFMRAEREILTAQLRREAIARVSSTFDPKQDAAQLIYQLQLMYQSEADARGDAGTEEMSQLHRLLSDYAVIQRLVNETLKAFNPKNAEEKRRFLNIGARNDGVITEQYAKDNQNAQIRYEYDNGIMKIYGELGTNREGMRYYDEAPRFHWYQLAGTVGDGRIGDGLVIKKMQDGTGTEVLPQSVYDWYGDNNATVRSGGLTPAEMRIVGMFSKDWWGSGNLGQPHPLETLYGATRPLQYLTDETNEGKGSLTLQRRDYWDKWSTQLADNVTILNQKNQLKQNEIENDSKKSNRHFDLGNNALRKMNEMLMSIGRM